MSGSKFYLRGFIFLILTLAISGCVWEDELVLTSPDEVLEAVAQKHDRFNAWPMFNGKIDYYVHQPPMDTIFINYQLINSNSYFDFSINYQSNKSEGRLTSDECFSELSNSNSKQKVDSNTHPFLGCQGAMYLNSHHTFFLGMPMNLVNTKKRVNDELVIESIDQQDFYVITIDFEPFNKEQLWEFYFNTKNLELSHARFRHLPDTLGGEFISFSSPQELNNMIFYMDREWFHNSDSSYVGIENYRIKAI